MEVEIKIPKPHSKKQRMIMEAFQIENLSELWVACGSKFGKTLSASAAICSSAPLKPNTTWRWVAPIYSQSKIGLKYCRDLLPGRPYVRTNMSDMTLNFDQIKTQMQFYHGQDPESLEGEAIHGYVLDEVSKMKPEVYSSAKTTTTVTRGPMIMVSTPRGKNWFYHKCMEAKEEMTRALKEGRAPRMAFIQAKTQDNPYVPVESIIAAKERLPDRLFRQYFHAEFVDDASVFTGIDDCVHGPVLEFENRIQRWVKKDAEEKTVVIGVDWAKSTDFTVFTAWTYEDYPEIIGLMRFQGVDYIGAVQHLVRFTKAFEEVSLIFHDKTGVGNAIDDILAQTPLPFEGVTFTNQSKSYMINSLIIGFETKKVRLPNWPEMIKELDGFEVVTNDLGNMRYSAPSGQHDDIIASMMLGYSAVQDLADHDFSVKIKENLTTKDLTIDSWYTDLIEENDEDMYI